MPTDVLDILFPLAGQSAIEGFQQMAPFTTPRARNCRPQDVFERRMRGGSRPMLAKAFATELGSGNHVNLLNSVRTGQENAPASSFEDEFLGSSLESGDPGFELWNYTNVATTTVVLPTVTGGHAIMPGSGGVRNVAAILDAISYDSAGPLEIESEIWGEDSVLNFSGGSSPGTLGTNWQLAFGLQNDTDYAGGCVVTLANLGSGKLTLTVENHDVILLTTNSYAATGSEILLRLVAGSLSIYLGTTTNLVATVTGITLSGTRVGFRIHDQSATRDAGFGCFIFRYFPSAATPIAEPALVAASNGTLYFESASGTMISVDDVSVGGPQLVNLASDRLLSSGERHGKLYIADYEVIADASDGVLSGTGTTFDSATYADWTALGATATNIQSGFMLELLSGGTGVYTPGVYSITTAAAGTLTISPDPGDTGASAIPFRLVRALKVFDYRPTGTGKLVKLVATGVVPVPVGCTIAVIWNDRLCLSGDPKNPGDTFMSEQGDPTIWAENADSSRSAVFGEFDLNTRIDEPVTALIPFNHDYLILGGVSTINVLRGNPTGGGYVTTVSRTVGILSQFAWCITPEGMALVMTGDGLYVIDNKAESAEPISRNRLPQEFLGFDTVNNDVQMEFDVQRNGVLIAVTPKVAGAGTFYWFDWSTKSFWPDSYQTAHHATAMTVYTRSGESTPTLILGCRDGYLREHLESATTDDGFQMDSEIDLGVFALGGGGYWDGMIRECIPQFSAQSEPVLVSVKIGRSIEDAYNATARPIGTAQPGKNFTMRPNLRGNCCFVRLSSIDGGRWAFEQATLTRERLGKQRLLSV